MRQRGEEAGSGPGEVGGAGRRNRGGETGRETGEKTGAIPIPDVPCSGAFGTPKAGWDGGRGPER